jgi:hypothetical protein
MPQDPMSAELKASIFERPDFVEVFGGFNLKLSLMRSEADALYPTRPILHFSGQSERTETDGRTTMHGWVRVTPDGHIRWHFVSSSRYMRCCVF